jgi:hypothetical protein
LPFVDHRQAKSINVFFSFVFDFFADCGTDVLASIAHGLLDELDVEFEHHSSSAHVDDDDDDDDNDDDDELSTTTQQSELKSSGNR